MNRSNMFSSLVLAGAIALPALASAEPPPDARSGADPRPVAHQDEHPGVHHDWHQGDRLPTTYRDARYTVSNWRGYHLDKPPAGYRWLQIDDQFVLARKQGGEVRDVRPAR